MSRTFEVEVAQTLYWLVTVEHDEEELEEQEKDNTQDTKILEQLTAEILKAK